MKSLIFVSTISFIVTCGYCGLVKDFFGTVHQEVHAVLDKTANAIGTVTHKIHEPFGVFVHRNEPNSKNVQETGVNEPASTSIPKTEAGSASTDKTSENNEKYHVESVPSNVKADNDHEPSTTSTTEQNSVQDLNNFDKVTSEDNGKIKIQPVKVPQENKETLTATENVLWNNDIKLENILPAALLNESHFKEVDLFAINAVRGSFNAENNTEDVSNGGNVTNPTGEPSNKAEREQNLISDQMIFPDSRNELKNQVKQCPKGLARTANGNCLEPIENKLKKKNSKVVSSVFHVDCPNGQMRALDGTCQPNLGWSTQ